LQHPETRHAVRSAPTSLKKNASPNRRFTIPEGTNRQRPASTSQRKVFTEMVGPGSRKNPARSLDVMYTGFPSNTPAFPEGRATGSSANRFVQESCGCPSPQTFIPGKYRQSDPSQSGRSLLDSDRLKSTTWLRTRTGYPS
jgi:hypothetical protein